MEVICTFITSNGETVTSHFLSFDDDVEAMKQHLITKCDAIKVLCITSPDIYNKTLFIDESYTLVKPFNDGIPF